MRKNWSDNVTYVRGNSACWEIMSIANFCNSHRDRNIQEERGYEEGIVASIDSGSGSGEGSDGSTDDNQITTVANVVGGDCCGENTQ